MDEYAPGSIWPAEDDDAIETREVYSRYGLAMFKAQVLEHGMVNAVIVARMMPTMREHPDRQAWEEAFDQAFDAELAKTFGNMLRALEPLGLPAGLMDRLRIAKVERDRLAHRFFREHDQDFLGPVGRTRMIAECEDAVNLFDGVDRALEAVMAPARERHGITAEWIAERMAEDVASVRTP